MKRLRKRAALVVFFSLFFFLPCSQASAAKGDTASEVKEFNLTLSRYSFNPNVIRVNQGDRVRFHLRSTDVEHGFCIRGCEKTHQCKKFGKFCDVTVHPQREVEVEFTADEAGVFPIRCSSTCGPFHPFMVGKLIVTPHSRLWITMLAFIFTPFAALLYFAWKRGGEEDEQSGS